MGIATRIFVCDLRTESVSAISCTGIQRSKCSVGRQLNSDWNKLSNFAFFKKYHSFLLPSQKSAALSRVVLPNLKSAASGRKSVGRKEYVPPLQFGEIYEWTQPKSVRLYTPREFGRRDLRSTVLVIIQSSCSHISHFESHRLWERTDLSYTQVTHVQAEKRKTTHARKLIHQMFFAFLRQHNPYSNFDDMMTNTVIDLI